MSSLLRARVYAAAGVGGMLTTADPSDIRRTLPRRILQRFRPATRARMAVQFFPGGPWDLEAQPFALHRYVEDIFVRGVPVEDSEQYRDMVARIQDPQLRGSVWGCRTVADVDRYFERLHEMFEDMRRHGYRTHRDLGATAQDEVKVRLGRDGSIIKCSGGNHRVSFAKLLGIQRIPVLLCGMHRGYVDGVGRSAGPDVISELLDSAGLTEYRQADVAHIARRLQVAETVRSTVSAPRRVASRGRDGSIIGVSLLDDAYLAVTQPAAVLGFLPGLG